MLFHREARIVRPGCVYGAVARGAVEACLPQAGISPAFSATSPASESPTPSTSPANSADAIPPQPPSSTHSTDAPRASASNKQSQISSSPRENPPLQDTDPLPHFATPPPPPPRCESPPANPKPQSFRPCSTPPPAPAHSSAPEYFPANRIVAAFPSHHHQNARVAHAVEPNCSRNAPASSARSSLCSAKRRQFQRHHPQPVKQILSKSSRANFFRQIPMRRADHPHVHFNRPRTTEPFDRPVLQSTQHLRLRHRTHIPNLIQKNRAARRQLEFSLCAAAPLP